MLSKVFKAMKTIQNSTVSPRSKLEHMKRKVIPQLPHLAIQLGSSSESICQLHDSVAIVLRGISVDAHNIGNDLPTSWECLELALKLVKSEEIRERLFADNQQIEMNRGAHSTSSRFDNANLKQQSSGCLLLLLAPSIVGISAISYLINQIT